MRRLMTICALFLNRRNNERGRNLKNLLDDWSNRVLRYSHIEGIAAGLNDEHIAQGGPDHRGSERLFLFAY
ncbi:hypothetical protein EMIT0P12_10087 [Pseudomonas sp. IT-P12]